jgi:hypothetical protein
VGPRAEFNQSDDQAANVWTSGNLEMMDMCVSTGDC